MVYLTILSILSFPQNHLQNKCQALQKWDEQTANSLRNHAALLFHNSTLLQVSLPVF